MPARYGDEPSSLSVTRVLFGFPPSLVSAMMRRLWSKYFAYDFGSVALFLSSGLPPRERERRTFTLR